MRVVQRLTSGFAPPPRHVLSIRAADEPPFGRIQAGAGFPFGRIRADLNTPWEPLPPSPQGAHRTTYARRARGV